MDRSLAATSHILVWISVLENQKYEPRFSKNSYFTSSILVGIFCVLCVVRHMLRTDSFESLIIVGCHLCETKSCWSPPFTVILFCALTIWVVSWFFINNTNSVVTSAPIYEADFLWLSSLHQKSALVGKKTEFHREERQAVLNVGTSNLRKGILLCQLKLTSY